MHNVIDPSLMPSIEFQLICAMRLLVACFCGAAIGFERYKSRKEAGLRTHIIVALGSCLATVASKYGFFDVVINESMQVDVSRIASNLLPSIAFLGAGMIFTRNNTIKGLTTAAGIWATAAVGIAIGAGLYLIGITATVLVVIIHVVFARFYDSGSVVTIRMRYPKEEVVPENLREYIENRFMCNVQAIDAKRTDSGSIHISIEVHTKGKRGFDNLSLALLKDPHFRGIDM